MNVDIVLKYLIESQLVKVEIGLKLALHIFIPRNLVIVIMKQESRTLEMNNVQDGIWHGRGDTICIGGFPEGGKSFFQLQPPPLISPMAPEA